MINEFKSTLERFRVGLRARLAKSLVAVLVGTLFSPILSMTSPTLISQSSAATTYNCSVSGNITVNSTTSSTNNACTGSVDLSSSGLTELNGTFYNKTGVTAEPYPIRCK